MYLQTYLSSDLLEIVQVSSLWDSKISLKQICACVFYIDQTNALCNCNFADTIATNCAKNTMTLNIRTSSKASMEPKKLPLLEKTPHGINGHMVKKNNDFESGLNLSDQCHKILLRNHIQTPLVQQLPILVQRHLLMPTYSLNNQHDDVSGIGNSLCALRGWNLSTSWDCDRPRHESSIWTWTNTASQRKSQTTTWDILEPCK